MTITNERHPAAEMGRLIDILRGDNDRLEATYPATAGDPAPATGQDRITAGLANLAGQLEAAYERGRADERRCWTLRPVDSAE